MSERGRLLPWYGQIQCKDNPEAIWEAPTAAEWDHVAMAVENYVDNGVFSAEPDGRYAWGQESVVIAPAISADDD